MRKPGSPEIFDTTSPLRHRASRQAGNKVQGLEDDVGGAVAVQGLR